jgi:5,6-dimethylbenzimidazole synthase
MDLYEAIYARRDVRKFRPGDVSDDVLTRILDAAHHAGSVGFMQPWNFTVVRDQETRRKIAASSYEENQRAAENYTGQRRELYESLRLDTIENSAVDIAVTCDRDRNGPHVLGRNTMPETDVYSTCCAIQNLWLAASAEGIGMCWMSVIDPKIVKAELGIPQDIVLVAYLCLGIPAEHLDRPMLEKAGWQTRAALADVVFSEQWERAWSTDAKIVSD